MAQLTRPRAAAPTEPAPRAPAALTLPWVLPLAVLVGAASVLAFPPYGLWPVAALTVTALTLLLRGRGAGAGALLGLAAGLGFFVPLLQWTSVVVGPAPWLMLGAFQALSWVPLGAAVALVTRLPGWPLGVACLWVAAEALRGRAPYGGFTWGRLAFSQADAPTVGLAAVGGAPLVTFAVALAGALLAAAVVAAVRRSAVRALAAAAGALAVTLAGLAVPATPPDGPTVTVAVVQGNVPQLGLDFAAQREAVLRNHVEATRDLAARVAAGEQAQPDLVVWPENSTDIDPYRDPGAAALISSAVDAIGVPVLVGAVVSAGEDSVANIGIVWAPGAGPGETYTKRHPVPFAEYVPLRPLARLVFPPVDELRPRDMVAGDEVGVLAMGPARVGDVICFEVAYDGLVRDAVTAGGQLLAVQTNNATFGTSPQTEQQLVMARLRAVEHARTVMVSATSGVSAVIGPDGSVGSRAEVFTRATLVEEVALSDRQTLATRLGAAPELAVAAAGVLAAGVALLAGRRGTAGRGPAGRARFWRGGAGRGPAGRADRR